MKKFMELLLVVIMMAPVGINAQSRKKVSKGTKSTVTVKKNTNTVKSTAPVKTVTPVKKSTTKVSNYNVGKKRSTSLTRRGKTSGPMFTKGSFTGNVSIGVGLRSVGGEGGATFTQKIGAEFGIAKVGKRGAVGLGFAIANSYGGRHTALAIGTYDYRYNWDIYYHYKKNGRWTSEHRSSGTTRRQGWGTANTKMTYDDVRLMATGSFHWMAAKKLEVYGTIGAGIGIANSMKGNFYNYEGFSSKNDTKITNPSHTCFDEVYFYDDKSHAVFDVKNETKVCVAGAFCGGIRYYVGNRFALFAEAGLDAWSGGSSLGVSDDLFGIGVTYKFR